MASDMQQPDRSTEAAAEARQAGVPLTNGTHNAAAADTSSALPPEVIIADVTAISNESSKQQSSAGDAAASGDDAADSSHTPAAETDSVAGVNQQLTDISLSQDLDSDSGAAEAAAVSLPAETADVSQLGASHVPLQQSPSLDEPLPASTARINSDAFFQEDEDEAKFTLDEGETPPQASPVAPPPVAAVIQTDAEREAQDREDEAIQQRLRRQREEAAAAAAASAADASRSVSPPVHNRPMSPPPGSAPRSPLPPPGIEPPEFRGLLYFDGIDTVGRPIVVVNARADAMLQPKLRNRAMEYMKRRLEPIVYQGPYVLCMIASGHQGDTSSKLPAMWLIRAYRSLSRPYKKNVKFIILVRPSAMLSTMMVVLRPFLSLKAARKLHKVDSLLDIDAVTGGDVKAEQLGARFLREELGVEPGTSLTPQGSALAPIPERAESLDEEVQLGSF